MLRRLYLHIGFHKTGTSSIQWALHNNKSILKDNSYYYFKTAQLDDHSHNKLGIVISNIIDGQEESIGGLNRYLKRLQEELDQQKVDNYILSAETLADFASSPAAEPLILFIKNNFDSVKVIAYLRRQDQHSQSVYQQWVKAGLVSSDIISFLNYFNDNFLPNLSSWANVFGKNNLRLGRYDQRMLLNSSLIEDFLDKIDLAPASISRQFRIPKTNLNRSLSFDALEIIRTLHIKPEFKLIADRVLKYLLETGSSEVFASETSYKYVSPVHSRQILDFYKESNNQIAKEYFKEEGNLFKIEDNVAIDIEWKQPKISLTVTDSILESLKLKFSELNQVVYEDILEEYNKVWTDKALNLIV